MVETDRKIKIGELRSSKIIPTDVLSTIKRLASKNTTPEQLSAAISIATKLHIAKERQKAENSK